MVYRTTTLTPLFALRREMDRLFDDTFGRTSASGWNPAVDVREEGESFVFELELPGVSPDAVEVTADNGVLSVSGEKRSEQEREGQRFHIIERTQGSFRRTFQLPQNVNEDAIEASFEHGVLTVRVPKAEVPKPRKIQIGGQSRAPERAQGRPQGEREVQPAPSAGGRIESRASSAHTSPADASRERRDSLEPAGR